MVTSMVIISITAVTKKNPRPIAVSLPALRVKEVTWLAITSMPRASGRKFCSTNCCSAAVVWPNTGKAVDTASATVNRGTSDSSVV